MFRGFITAFLSFDYLVIPIFLVGAITSLFPLKSEPIKVNKSLPVWEVFLISVISLASGFIIYSMVNIDQWPRIIISLLFTITVFIISLLDIFPIDYDIDIHIFRLKKAHYLLIPIFAAITVFVGIRHLESTKTSVNQLPNNYQIVFVNRNTNSDLTQKYKGALSSKGYTNIIIKRDGEYPSTTSQITVIYDPKDVKAGSEIVQILKGEVSDVQTVPPLKPQQGSIIVILQ